MNWKIIGRSLKHQDMQKRLLAVMGMLLVFRVLAHVPIPLSDPQTLKQVLENLFTATQSTQLLGFLNILSGGALANFSIMLIGLGPYISASIIMQLLTHAIPKLETLNKEGEYGRKKINQYTRILTVPLAIIQSIGTIFLVRQTAGQIAGIGDITSNASMSQWVLMVAALTGGSILLMWLGELITEQGVGNGISLLITVGIVASLPALLGNIASSIFSSDKTFRFLGMNLPFGKGELFYASIIIGLSVLAIYLVVKLNEASRNLTVNYAKRVQGNRTYGGVTTLLPVKLITAGVVPIIFAVAFLSVPSFIGQIMSYSSNPRFIELGTNLTSWFATPTTQKFLEPGFAPYIYPIIYFLLVFMFTYFYTGLTFNSKEISENLQKQGGFIEGVRSGNETEKYLAKVVNRLTFFGAMSLGMLAVAPVFIPPLLYKLTGIALNEGAISGTSILILVAVSLETLRQIESRALMVTYDDYSTPEFFYSADQPHEAALGARSLRFLPFSKKKSKSSKKK